MGKKVWLDQAHWLEDGALVLKKYVYLTLTYEHEITIGVL
jgi:hypothetical protein